MEIRAALPVAASAQEAGRSAPLAGAATRRQSKDGLIPERIGTDDLSRDKRVQELLNHTEVPRPLFTVHCPLFTIPLYRLNARR